MAMNIILRYWGRGEKAWASAQSEVNMDAVGLAMLREPLLKHV